MFRPLKPNRNNSLLLKVLLEVLKTIIFNNINYILCRFSSNLQGIRINISYLTKYKILNIL